MKEYYVGAMEALLWARSKVESGELSKEELAALFTDSINRFEREGARCFDICFASEDKDRKDLIRLRKAEQEELKIIDEVNALNKKTN